MNKNGQKRTKKELENIIRKRKCQLVLGVVCNVLEKSRSREDVKNASVF